LNSSASDTPVRLFALLLALGVAVCASPQVAQAQMVPRSLEVDVFGGGYLFGGICPTGTTNRENLWCSAIVGGRLSFHLNEHVAIEGTLGYVPTRTADTGRTVHYVLPHFDLLLHATRFRVVPYFAVGAGWQSASIKESYRSGVPNTPSTQWRDPYASGADLEGTPPNAIAYPRRSTDFVFDIGGGAKFLIFQRGGIRIDARYVLSIGPGNPELNGVPSWDVINGQSQLVWKDMFHHAEFTVGAFFVLGGGPGRDSDGDGLPDREDECPDRAEDRDGFQDGDGCPDLDNDSDGVDDSEDQCPLKAENKNGFEDEDGCPDVPWKAREGQQQGQEPQGEEAHDEDLDDYDEDPDDYDEDLDDYDEDYDEEDEE